MEKRKKAGNRMIQVKDGIIGPREPRQKTLKVKQAGDYTGTPGVYLEVCELYGTKFNGPPLCDEMMAFIQHMFTEEEASVVRHLKPLSIMTAGNVAESEKRTVEEVREILDRLALEKRIILSFGAEGARSYMLIPLLPGAFELVLIRKSMDTLTDWHRRFAELFEELYETGFSAVETKNMPAGIRYLPISNLMKTHPMALPSDRIEEVIEPYSSFAVGLCQCRMTEVIVGRGCGRPMDNCTALGPMADMGVLSGNMRRVEKKELLDIKAEAEASGLVNWIQTVEIIPGANTMCSCCGCCCHAMRIISEFNMPGMIAPPHFMPEVDGEKCDHCGKCAKACPMGAITIDTRSKTRAFESVRCVGCGQCFVACDKKQAIQLEPVEGYTLQKGSFNLGAL